MPKVFGRRFGISAPPSVFSSVFSKETLLLAEFPLVPESRALCDAEVKFRRPVLEEHLTPGPQLEIKCSLAYFLWCEFVLVGKPRF